MQKHITSLQNPLIKKIVQLQEKSRLRKESKLFIIEGVRECQLAQKGGYQFKTILICDEIIDVDKLSQRLDLSNHKEIIIYISKEVYQKISHRKTTEGIVVISNSKNFELSKLSLPENPVILVAEAPEKPGNIGALLRTADAAKLDAVIITNLKTDMYNPNIIRSSVGCLFTTNIATGITNEIIAYLKSNQIDLYAATLDSESIDYTSVNYNRGTAIVVGTESEGLSKPWLENATKKIMIPMEGEIDSLNVSVSAAIIIFEVKRQRKLN